MEVTPGACTEDSGCVKDASSDLYAFTPLTTFPPNRKAKLTFCSGTRDDIDTPSSAFYEGATRKRPNIFSSTLNTDLDTPTCDFDSSKCFKKLKLEDSPHKFTCSESIISHTPQKFIESTCSNSNKRKLPTFVLGLRKSTPIKSCEKLGSTEKNQILYPTVPCTRSLPKSPTKLACKKRLSPAKKRLFDGTAILGQSPSRKIDFVSLFTKQHNLATLIEVIFNGLSTADLVQVSMVSKAWRGALFRDPANYKRYVDFVCESHSSKENFSVVTEVPVKAGSLSPPVSPSRREFYKFTKLAQSLQPGQSIKRCALCQQPAVIQEHIGQCQSIACNYIFCLLCGSFSISGPENFQDKCQHATLVVDKPQTNTRTNNNLTADTSDCSSILTLTTPESRSMFDSSGYVSGNEPLNASTPSVKRNLYRQGFALHKEEKHILKDSNASGGGGVERRARRRSSIIYPVSVNTTPVFEDPPSPPHVIIDVPCSKQSKKNLKRLRL